MLKYTVYYNDDRAEFTSNRRLTTEEIAEHIGCECDEIVTVDFEDAE